MAQTLMRELTQIARSAGYQVVSIEQLRSNRWLMILSDARQQITLVLAQARPLVGASDVQDLAEIVRLRQPERGILLAYGGVFSVVAQQTLAELRDSRLRLCTVLPPAVNPETDAAERTALGVPAKRAL
jgi:hypothetical protein